MSKNTWIVLLIGAGVLALWLVLRPKAAPRVPVTRGDVGDDGILGSVNRTINGVGTIFRSLGGSSNSSSNVQIPTHGNTLPGDPYYGPGF